MSKLSKKPDWKLTAVRAVVVAACANGLYVANAGAVQYCGPTVNADMSTQCVMQPYSAADQQVNSGVTIRVTSNEPAILYWDDLGYSEGASYGSLTNNGTVISEGSASDWYYGNTGVQINGELMGTLTNNGVIKGISNNPSGSAYAFGVFESRQPAMQGTLTNNGLISANATASGAGNTATAGGLIVNWSMYPTAVVDNRGTISATATGNDGADAIAYGIGIGYMNGGVINNSGTITGTAANGRGYSIFVAGPSGTGGTINNLATGTLSGSLYVADTSTVNNAGTIDLPLGSNAYIGGNYNQAATGTLRIGAESSNTEGGYSRVMVSGAATIDGKAYVDVKTVNTLAVGQKLMNVVSAGTLNGNFSSVEDNSTMFNFRSLATTGASGHIDLEILKGLTAEQSVTTVGNNPAVGAARTFDAIVDQSSSYPGMQTVIDKLGVLDSEKNVSDAVSQTMPLLTGGSMLAAGNALTGINRVIQARVENNRGMSSGDAFLADKNMWFKPFGSWADQDDRNAVSGFKARTAGFAIGGDSAVSDASRMGIAFAYAKSKVTGNSNVAAQSADVDVYQLVGYGSYKLDDRTELNYQVDVGNNKNDGRRSIAFMGTTANASYDSYTAHAGFGIGRSYPISEQTTWTPSLRADYTWIRDAAYSESGAGPLNLNVAGRGTEEFIVGADAKMMHKLNDSTSLTANVGVGYDTINKQASVTAAFAGAAGLSFVTNGLKQDPWLARAGFGLVHKTTNGVEVTARYDLEYRQGFSNQTASVKARWSF